VIPSGVEIYIGLQPIDLRWGLDRLAGLVEEQLGRPSRSGALFVFYGKRKSALKILFYDGSGLCQFYKRLDRGTFRVPETENNEVSLTLSERELDDLLDGISVDQPTQKQPRFRMH
jgi:transposase